MARGVPERASRVIETDDRPRLQWLISAVALRHDREALAELCAHYAPKVKSLAIRMGAGERADDIAQQTLIAMWRKASAYDPATMSISTWVYMLARDLIIDGRRGRDFEGPTNRGAALEAGDGDTPLSQPGDTAHSTPHLRSVIAHLPAQQAEILRLLFLDGKSHSQIAEELHLPLDMIKSLVRQATGHLRAALEAKP